MKKQIVIIGGGFGGLRAARALKAASVDVTLIDRRNYHLFQPLLYQVAAVGRCLRRLRQFSALSAGRARSAFSPSPRGLGRILCTWVREGCPHWQALREREGGPAWPAWC